MLGHFCGLDCCWGWSQSWRAGVVLQPQWAHADERAILDRTQLAQQPWFADRALLAMRRCGPAWEPTRLLFTAH